MATESASLPGPRGGAPLSWEIRVAAPESMSPSPLMIVYGPIAVKSQKKKKKNCRTRGVYWDWAQADEVQWGVDDVDTAGNGLEGFRLVSQ